MATPRKPSARAWLPPLLLTALAYALAARLALLLAVSPGYASPLWPAAGIALACTLRYGPRAAAGVALGAFAANAAFGAARGLGAAGLLLLPALIAAGAAAQALVGAALVRRFVRQPLTLAEGGDVLRFFGFGAALACLVSASVGTAALFATGTLDAADAPLHWLIWWAGDALGVLVAAPVVLTLVGRPRDAWASRRSTVGLPLALATLLLGLGIAQVARWDAQRLQQSFERDAAGAATALAASLRTPLHALQALQDLMAVEPALSREQMRRAAAGWLQQEPQPQAIGWSVRVPREQLAGFEAAARADGLADYRVFDRSASGGDTAASAPADEVLAIRYIEPLAANRPALGLNQWSVPQVRRAVEQARALGRPVASAGFRLTQESAQQTGVVVYQPVFDDLPSDAAGAPRELRGVLFLTLRIGDLLQQAMAGQPGYLQACLLDAERGAGQRLLAGPPGCDRAAAGPLHHARMIDFAGRRWQLRIDAEPGRVPGVPRWNAWLFALVGVFPTALLGALLLTMTGRARRIERAVRERTVELERVVDERTRTTDALRDSEQRLRNILDHAPIGVLYTDLRGYTRDSNPFLRELIGYRADELASMVALELTHPDDRAADAELAGRLVRGDLATYRRRKRCVRKDGRIVWVQTIVSLLRDAQGQPHRVVAVVEDIGEHLKLQRAEDARAAAEAANRAKSEFLSRMSHELRTPLNAMLGFTQLLELDREAPLSAAQRSWTAQVQQAGWHLLEMINDTLDLSRIESGSVRLQTRPLELAPLTAAARSLVETQAAERGIALVEQPSLALLAVLGDETRVKQILTNLLSNAVKYNVAGGRVDIAARVVGGAQVEIDVVDSGPGLDERQLAQLFQPFNRLGREDSGIEGTGIGLVISRRLAELMGGSLHARSTPGVGSTFVLMLPLAVDIDPTAAPEADATLPQLPPYRRRAVLYIEDNETNAEVMRGILLQRPQVELQVAATGRAAFAALERERLPDLILLDLHLPDMDGIDVLQRLKASRATAAVPVVVVSADATPARVAEATAGGAEAYLTKPVDVAELLAAIDALLGALETRF